MSKTTITICGEECVVLPAPKGAFILGGGDSYPEFVPYIAVETIVKEYPSGYKDIKIHQLRNHGKSLELLDFKKCSLRNIVFNIDLQKLYEDFKEVGDYDMRKVIMTLYELFINHRTTMSLSAIDWFKEKFKEHNITKADFDVFA